MTCRNCETERFWAKVKRGGDAECWIWIGAKDGRYGAARLDGRHMKAHRVAWTLTNGPIPLGKILCHRCDVTACVNPAHLFVGTSKDNMDDMIRKGRARFPIGERQYKAKLTADAVRAIRAQHADGASVQALAKAFGVVDTTIHRVVTGVAWKHVGPAGADLIRKDVYGR
jgi:hypothetical protein